MQIVLTRHVIERRKSGLIPEDRLYKFAKHLIKQHDLISKECGPYKFRFARTQAVISKNKGKFIFITLFGPSGYIIESDDFGEFNCVLQSPELLEKKRLRNEKNEKRRAQRTKEIKVEDTIPLGRLSSDNQARLDKETFEIYELSEEMAKEFKKKVGQNPRFILKSKFNYQIADILSYNGSVIKSIHTNQLKEICEII